MSGSVTFFVPGIAQPQGSKRLLHAPNRDEPVMVEDARQARPWRQAIRSVLFDMPERPDLQFGEVVVQLVFRFPRPKSHFGEGKNAGAIKDSKIVAPFITAPDLDKLCRAVGDALTDLIYKDDSQVSELRAHKRYCSLGEDPGMEATVWWA